MWELDNKKGWAPKNWFLRTVVLEKILESPFDCTEIKPVNPKGNQSWIFIGRTDAEAEAPILWPPNVKDWLIGKHPDAGKDWMQEEKGMTEDEMVGWHHWLSRHEFEQTPGDGEGPGSLACCSPQGLKESDRTEWLNTTTCVGALVPTENSKVFCYVYSLRKNQAPALKLHYCFWTVSPLFLHSLPSLINSSLNSQPRDQTIVSRQEYHFLLKGIIPPQGPLLWQEGSLQLTPPGKTECSQFPTNK